MDGQTMGQRIAGERKKLGISQEALGDKMGVSRQAISKWEADGAVPEIDKLVGMSKLFGVSVGWILGVEEETRQEDLSEQQLHMVEELVKRYQPKPRRKWPWILAAGICAALFAALFLQTGSLRAESAGIREAVSGLKTQISTLNQTWESAREDQFRLLDRYGLDITGVHADGAGNPQAVVAFHGVPLTWREGDRAYLSLLRDGQTLEQECEKGGAFLTAEMTVKVADGYSLCLTIAHADGTQDQQPLMSDTVQLLKKSLALTASGRVAEVFYGNNKLRLQDCQFTVERPALGMDYGEASWERVELILFSGDNQKELGRFNLLSDETGEVGLSPSIVTVMPAITFENLELSSNAEFQLWLWARLDNGLEAMEPIMYGSLDAEGNLVSYR